LPKSTFADIPDNVELSARAARDLKGIIKKNRQEAIRVVDDLVRLAKRVLPTNQAKKLTGMGALWELDSGRYRIVYLWKERILFIVTVFPKADQRKVIHHLRA
jgi:mRNA-degrading endonuclease RelE of RelBE toxin-antitoxin system